MKFGDQAKLTDELWDELKNIIKDDSGWYSNKLDQLENKFICLQYSTIIGVNTYWIASLTPKLTDACGGVGMTTWKANFGCWSFWIDHKAVSGDVMNDMSLDEYHGAAKAGWPENWKVIVPKRMIVFRMDYGVLPYEDIKTKPVHSGGKCLICKDFNPYMEQDGFCWSCNSDPRNKYKKEEILVKMASV